MTGILDYCKYYMQYQPVTWIRNVKSAIPRLGLKKSLNIVFAMPSPTKVFLKMNWILPSFNPPKLST
jgi:hypothetical protein